MILFHKNVIVEKILYLIIHLYSQRYIRYLKHIYNSTYIYFFFYKLYYSSTIA